jgi:hypothetical protein
MVPYEIFEPPEEGEDDQHPPPPPGSLTTQIGVT